MAFVLDTRVSIIIISHLTYVVGWYGFFPIGITLVLFCSLLSILFFVSLACLLGLFGLPSLELGNFFMNTEHIGMG